MAGYLSCSRPVATPYYSRNFRLSTVFSQKGSPRRPMLFGLATLSLAPSDEGAVSEADWGRDTPEVRLFGLSLRQNLRFCHLPHQREAGGVLNRTALGAGRLRWAYFPIARKVGKGAVKGRVFRVPLPLTNPTHNDQHKGGCGPLIGCIPRGTGALNR